MDMLNSVKFVACLIKCGKLMYIAKKMLCIVTVMIAVISAVRALMQNKSSVKKMLRQLKAVM